MATTTGAALLFLASVALADAANVNLNTGTFSWAAPVVDATHGAPASYTMKCGPASALYLTTFSVAAPATSVPVKNVVGAGTWFCVVTAVNAGGESPPSNEVTFQGAFPPGSSTLTVQ